MQYLSLLGIILHEAEYSHSGHNYPKPVINDRRRGREMRVKLCLYLCPTLESSSSLIWRCLNCVCTVGLFSRKQSFLVSLDKSCWKFVSVIEHFQHCHVRWNLNVILYWPLTLCEDKSLRFAPDRVLSTIYSVQFPVTSSLRTPGTRKCSQIF